MTGADSQQSYVENMEYPLANTPQLDWRPLIIVSEEYSIDRLISVYPSVLESRLFWNSGFLAAFLVGNKSCFNGVARVARR